MKKHPSLRRCELPRLALVLLTATCGMARIDPVFADDKAAAAKVARKIEKARAQALEDAADAAKESRHELRHFQKKLDEYALLHLWEFNRLGAPESAATQQALAVAIRVRRVKAKQGDIFLREIQPLLRLRIKEQLEGPDAKAAREAVAEGNPGDEDPSPVIARINGLYSLGSSRSTVPASVLLALPVLPECLHYRFVNRDLILIDSVAQIIIDILPLAAPVLPLQAPTINGETLSPHLFLH